MHNHGSIFLLSEMSTNIYQILFHKHLCPRETSTRGRVGGKPKKWQSKTSEHIMWVNCKNLLSVNKWLPAKHSPSLSGTIWEQMVAGQRNFPHSPTRKNYGPWGLYAWTQPKSGHWYPTGIWTASLAVLNVQWLKMSGRQQQSKTKTDI